MFHRIIGSASLKRPGFPFLLAAVALPLQSRRGEHKLMTSSDASALEEGVLLAPKLHYQGRSWKEPEEWKGKSEGTERLLPDLPHHCLPRLTTPHRPVLLLVVVLDTPKKVTLPEPDPISEGRG
jgi:hypothetical protein